MLSGLVSTMQLSCRITRVTECATRYQLQLLRPSLTTPVQSGSIIMGSQAIKKAGAEVPQ